MFLNNVLPIFDTLTDLMYFVIRLFFSSLTYRLVNVPLNHDEYYKECNHIIQAAETNWFNKDLFDQKYKEISKTKWNERECMCTFNQRFRHFSGEFSLFFFFPFIELPVLRYFPFHVNLITFIFHQSQSNRQFCHITS